MNREERQRIKSIAADALGVVEAERGTYLVSRCGADEALRREVDSLLLSTAEAADLYETPALAIAGGAAAIGDLEFISRGRIDTCIGPYRIVRELGAMNAAAQQAIQAITARHGPEKGN